MDQLTTRILRDDKWRRTVKGFICEGSEGKPYPPIFPPDLDMLIGPMSASYDAIRSCFEPEPSSVTQFVIVNASIQARLCIVMRASVLAMIYLH